MDTLCPGCGKPFDSPDHDPRCSSCAESGTLEDPPPPGATHCPHCARLLREICRLSYELGKAQGELEGLRIMGVHPPRIPQTDAPLLPPPPAGHRSRNTR